MLIGRDREWLQLGGALAQVGGGAGAIALVTGEAGIGKTHLATALADAALRQGFSVARGRCFADAGQVAFSPWREALGDAGLGARRGRARLGPREDRTRSFEAVLTAIAARTAAGPLLVVIEDLHWADRDSLALFVHVARFGLGAPLLLLGTVRTPDRDAANNPALDDLLAELARESRTTLLALRPLALDGVAALSAAVAGAPVPQTMAQAIAAESGGNALYVRELSRHLLEEGKLVLRDGCLATDFSAEALGLPPSIRHLVRQRVGRLAPAAVAVLRAAALKAGGIDAATLGQAAELDDVGLARAIDEAVTAGLLRASGAGFELSHAVVGRAIAEELTPDRRARLHRRLAEALEALHPGERAEIAAQHHAARALPGSERGFAHALFAGQAAQASGAHERAAEFFAMAADLAAPLGEAEVGRSLAEWAIAAAGALDAAAAVALAERAGDLFRRAGEAARVPELYGAVARVLADGGVVRAQWEPLVRRGLALVAHAASARDGRGELAWARLKLLERALVPVVVGPFPVAHLAPADPGAVRVLQATGNEADHAATLEPHDARTPEATAALETRLAGWHEPAAVMRALDLCARDRFFRDGDFRGALALAEELAALAVRVGAAGSEVAGLVVLGCAAAVLGDLPRARAAHERAAALGRRLGALHRLSLIGPLAVATTIGVIDEIDWPPLTEQLLGFAASPAAAATPFGFVAQNLGLVACAMAGDVAGARRLFPSHLRALEGLSPALNDWAAGRDCGATAVWLLGDRAHAPAYLEHALAGVGQPACAPWSTASASAARLLAITGELERALPLFAAARTELEASGRLPARAIVDYDEAWAFVRVGQGADPRAAARLAEARAAFERFGMQRWRRAADDLAARLVPTTLAAPDGLSERELEVLRLVARGAANKEIATALFISVPTVERHVANIYNKIGVRSRAAAAGYALRKGLVPG